MTVLADAISRFRQRRKSRLQERWKCDPRQVAVVEYADELRQTSPSDLLAAVPGEDGFWSLGQVHTASNGVKVGATFLHVGAGRSLVLVEPMHTSRVHRVFGEGFALQAGHTENLTDDDWVALGR